MREESYTMQ